MRSARSLAQFAQSQSTLLLKDGIPLAHLTLVRVPSHAHDTHVGRLHASSPAYMRRMNPDMSSVVGHARHGLLEQQTRPTASVPSAGPPTAQSPQRPCVRGKFLFVGEGLADGLEGRLRSAIAVGEPEAPIFDVGAGAVPLVRPGEDEGTGTAGREGRPDLPAQ